jgi:pentatricopeptide repeat protein
MRVFAHMAIIIGIDSEEDQWQQIGEHLVLALARSGSPQDALSVHFRLSSRTQLSWKALISCLIDRGLCRDALLLFGKMTMEDGVRADAFALSSFIRACGTISDLGKGRELHAHARSAGLCSDAFVGNTLITMYRKCGSFGEAEEVFAELPTRDAVSWNSMISAYVHGEDAEKALLLYRQMREECGDAPNQQSLVMALRACGMLASRDEGNVVTWRCCRAGNVVTWRCCRTKYLEIVRGLHVEARRNGFDSHPVVGTTILMMYGKCGTIDEAELVAAGLADHDLVSLTAMLSAYAHQNRGERALQLYRRMLLDGFDPDSKAFAVALQACGSLSPPKEEKDELGIDDNDDDRSLMVVASFAIAKALHGDAWRKGYGDDAALGSILVSIYGKCGGIAEAEGVFRALAHRDCTTWTSLMSAYIDQGRAQRVVLLYRQMRSEGVEPDHQTVATVLQACGIIAEDEEAARIASDSSPPRSIKAQSTFDVGRALHADARSRGFLQNSFVSNALVSLYAKCGAIREAENVFASAEMLSDAALWVRMLSAYMELGQAEKALQFFAAMHSECNRDANPHAFLVAVQACGVLAQREGAIAMEGRSVKPMGLEIGRALLADARRRELHLDAHLATAFVNLLGKCGSIEDAEMICEGLPMEPDVVLLTALLSVYVEQGQGEKALELYGQLRHGGMHVLDDITLVCVLQACARTGSFELSRELHFAATCASKNALSCYLASALAYAYGSCACSTDTESILGGLIEPDLVTWNACVASYAGEGNLRASLRIAAQMQLAGSDPDEVTFVSLISASSHAGLVDEGLFLFFGAMSEDHGLNPDLKHYGTLLDLLGRAGDFAKLRCVVRRMMMVSPSQADQATWLCLLGACRIHGNLEIAQQAFESAVKLQPKESAPYILMSRIYLDSGLPQLAEEVHSRRPQGSIIDTSWLDMD